MSVLRILRAKLQFSTLRLRLILAFLLVSVPPMLGAAFAVATLISNTFETNVQDWLGETASYFASQIEEGQNDADHIAHLMAHRLESEYTLSSPDLKLFQRDLETLSTVGFNFIVVYDDADHIYYGASTLADETNLPKKSVKTILSMRTAQGGYLLNCATVVAQTPERRLYVLVGSALDQTYLGESKAINSIIIRLFERQNGIFPPLALPEDNVHMPPPPRADIVARLDSGQDIVVDENPGDGIYKALYASVRNDEKQLLGAVFIGLSADDSFYAQISQIGLFPGIFLIGTLLSTLAGLWLAGYLSKPLKALTSGVRAVTAGDYTAQVPLRGGVELSELARGFNGMATQLSKLQELEDQLRRKDRLSALGQASAVIAHEVRNPLGIIKTSAEVVRNRADLRPAELRLLGYIIDETRRIERLIQDVLNFAHPKAVQHDPVRFRLVVDGVLAMAQPQLAALHITALVSDEAPGAFVLADADQLHQAILNLILNAQEAMPEGGHIHIYISQQAGRLYMRVCDSGQGIAPEIAERIFDPFFTTKAKGTGLGLAQVHSLAEALGGRVFTEHHSAQGAIFCLDLPLLRVEPQDREP